MHKPDLSEPQVRLVEVVYVGLRDSGAWPTTTFVDAVLDHDHNLDLDAVLGDMPFGIVTASAGYEEHSTVQVSAAGLRHVEAAAGDLEKFVELVRFAAERERQLRPGPREAGRMMLSSEEASKIWSEPPAKEELGRVFAIAQREGVDAGSSGPDDAGRWTLYFDRRVRGYRGVSDIDDYIARRPDPTPRAWAPPPPRAPYVFVLMPFSEEWSANVKDAIDQACQEVARQFAGLTWERADDITQPGRITDQIVSAIERADVLIADITGTNANVLFELGYGDALKKPTIVLNQHIERTPFDIKDWRQIVYSTGDLAGLRQTLVDFLAGPLRTRGFPPPSPAPS